MSVHDPAWQWCEVDPGRHVLFVHGVETFEVMAREGAFALAVLPGPDFYYEGIDTFSSLADAQESVEGNREHIEDYIVSQLEVARPAAPARGTGDGEAFAGDRTSRRDGAFAHPGEQGRALWNAYRCTLLDVVLPDGTTRRLVPDPARRGGGDVWPFLADALWVVTAQNPMSKPLPREENAQRHTALGEELAALGCSSWACQGRDPDDSDWSEDGYAVAGLTDEQAFDIAARWGQNAVFVLTPQQIVLVGVLLCPHRRDPQGWGWA